MLNKPQGEFLLQFLYGKRICHVANCKTQIQQFELTSQKLLLFEFSEILVQSKKRVLKIFCFQKCVIELCGKLVYPAWL